MSTESENRHAAIATALLAGSGVTIGVAGWGISPTVLAVAWVALLVVTVAAWALAERSAGITA